ncbi:MAG TPA: FecR domain-containing protein [Spirochaetota bacterium]|nr:FecR domain-containing protein [Spirochaetota bacterium]
MDAHLKDKDIDKLVSGIMGRREILRAEKHLEVCGSCRKKVNILSGIISEKKIDSVAGDHVKVAVIAEWHRTNSGVIAKHEKPVFSLRLAYGLAAAVLIAVSAYFIVTSIPNPTYKNGLSVTSITGEVKVNNTAADMEHMLRKGDLVSTGRDSSVSLTTGNYSLELEGSSELKLAASGGDTGFIFNLNSGAATSRSAGKIKYSFICGKYSITPTGTEFRLEMSQGRLSVAVFTGGVIISGTNLQIEVPAGMKWDSDDPVKFRSAETGNSMDAITEKVEYTEKNTGDGDKFHDSGNKINRAEPGEIRDLKRESREEIRDMRDMKKESREGRQFKGGN